jgi:hypothetical protein
MIPALAESGYKADQYLLILPTRLVLVATDKDSDISQ